MDLISKLKVKLLEAISSYRLHDRLHDMTYLTTLMSMTSGGQLNKHVEVLYNDELYITRVSGNPHSGYFAHEPKQFSKHWNERPSLCRCLQCSRQLYRLR